MENGSPQPSRQQQTTFNIGYCLFLIHLDGMLLGLFLHYCREKGQGCRVLQEAGKAP